jgi:16S rRNA (cytosine1402-N4)-methyltransferase
MYHSPVLLEETLDLLAPQPGETVIDATLGDGGHSEALLIRVGLTGRLLGIDASPTSLARARHRLEPYQEQVTLIRSNFSHLATVARAADFVPADIILFDLGIAAWQLGLDADQPATQRDGHDQTPHPTDRVVGLSFQRDEPLDMRLNPDDPQTAATILNESTPSQLELLFETYGDIRRARPLVARLISARRSAPLTTTGALVRAVGTRVPQRLAPIFQALRIAVNRELDVLPVALDQALDLLKPGGRLAVLSYHSGEDRIVKQAFVAASRAGHVTRLTDRPISPSRAEQRRNRRSRSAKLRAVRRNEG